MNMTKNVKNHVNKIRKQREKLADMRINGLHNEHFDGPISPYHEQLLVLKQLMDEARASLGLPTDIHQAERLEELYAGRINDAKFDSLKAEANASGEYEVVIDTRRKEKTVEEIGRMVNRKTSARSDWQTIQILLGRYL